MNRYFLEVRYKGTHYAGFQKQRNAQTIQSVIEHALAIFLKQPVELTGSSRTDTGVHAIQNYFHFDFPGAVDQRSIYNLNSLLPSDISITKIIPVKEDAHCRFDAIARSYEYRVYARKDPFLQGLGYYYPYRLNRNLLNQAACLIVGTHNFEAFSKRNTQVSHFNCTVLSSSWEETKQCLVYKVKANRFLRGMVRGLTGTMLQIGRQKIAMEQFCEIFTKLDSTRVDFSVPGHGLFLEQVEYPEGLLAII